MLPTEDFPVTKLRRATEQVVTLGGYYDGGRPVEAVAGAVYISKNLGPLYAKERPYSVVRCDPGVNYLTLSAFDTDEPGILNVQVQSHEQFLQYWFEIE